MQPQKQKCLLILVVCGMNHSQMKKPPIKRAVSNTISSRGRSVVEYDASKQLQPAMTFQVYTKSIKRRKPIVFINALVSLVESPSSGLNRFCDNGANFSIRVMRSRPTRPIAGYRDVGSLPKSEGVLAYLIKRLMDSTKPRSLQGHTRS